MNRNKFSKHLTVPFTRWVLYKNNKIIIFIIFIRSPELLKLMFFPTKNESEL